MWTRIRQTFSIYWQRLISHLPSRSAEGKTVVVLLTAVAVGTVVGLGVQGLLTTPTMWSVGATCLVFTWVVALPVILGVWIMVQTARRLEQWLG